MPTDFSRMDIPSDDPFSGENGNPMYDMARYDTPALDEPDEERFDPLADIMDDPNAGVACKYITGPAGSGKTYGLRKMIEDDPKAGLLCATTGVAAVNLGTVTLNSVLKYFNTESLMDAYMQGRLTRQLQQLAKQYRELFIDEVSMMDGNQLDILTQATQEANQRSKHKLGITLTGDFCQLPPVKAKWAFEAQCWDRYAENIVKLTKIYRQDDPEFLSALNAARSGDGKACAETLRGMTKWKVAVDINFEGTTIMAKNASVDRHNWLRYMQLPEKERGIRTERWGLQRGEWKLIPDVTMLKKGAFVMILANAQMAMGSVGPQVLEYANGDCGHIVDIDKYDVLVKLNRNGKEVWIPLVTRRFESKEKPKEGTPIWSGLGVHRGEPYYDRNKKRWVYGAVTYCPLRLAYATTVHKSQGLTLDNVQVDIRDGFFGQPAMAYVALSRARSTQGLSIVGAPEMLARRITFDPKVAPWV